MSNGRRCLRQQATCAPCSTVNWPAWADEHSPMNLPSMNTRGTELPPVICGAGGRMDGGGGGGRLHACPLPRSLLRPPLWNSRWSASAPHTQTKRVNYTHRTSARYFWTLEQSLRGGKGLGEARARAGAGPGQAAATHCRPWMRHPACCCVRMPSMGEAAPHSHTQPHAWHMSAGQPLVKRSEPAAQASKRHERRGAAALPAADGRLTCASPAQ